MPMSNNDARQFKFAVLIEICNQAYSGKVEEERVHSKAKDLVSLSSTRYRCCVYKEREIIRQRVRLSLGHMASDSAEFNPHQIVQVIDAACDGCTIKKIRVTDNCRKCMTKSCLSACRFNAIDIGPDRAQIDYEKCKECGACARACPYNAIVVTERPCYAHCPVDAISWNDNGIAVINEEKCINCGQCVDSCPFGAIEDISWVVPVIQLLKMDTPCYAIVAPSIQGQYDKATLGQIKSAIKGLGFTDCLEVAMGADAIAYREAEELVKHMEKGMPMTTSCCTAFVNMLEIHFPDLYKNNKSTLVTPMMALARKLKKENPDYGVVFIGPCLAKKQEAMVKRSAVDYVLTFEELYAMFVAKKIVPSECEDYDNNLPSNYGRNFAASSGVANAVMEVIKERDLGEATCELANGGKECKMKLMQMQKGEFKANILEGMCCPGGCLAGPAVIEPITVTKAAMIKENMSNKERTVLEAINENSFEGVSLEVE